MRLSSLTWGISCPEVQCNSPFLDRCWGLPILRDPPYRITANLCCCFPEIPGHPCHVALPADIMSSGLTGQDPWLGRLIWKKRLPESLAVKCYISYCQSANQKIEYPSASLNLTISLYPSVKARWKFPIIRNIWKHLETAKCKDMLCCLCKGRGWTAFGSCRSWLIGICPRVQFHEHTHCACHMMSHDRKKWKTYHHTVWTQAQTHRFRCILGALLVGYPLKSIIDKQNMCDSRALGSTLDWSKCKAFNQSVNQSISPNHSRKKNCKVRFIFSDKLQQVFHL